MNQIKPMRPRHAKAVIAPLAERRHMNSFRDTDCESCGVHDGTVVGAHINLNRGGTGYRAKGCIVGLCKSCHDILDRRGGTPEDRMWVLERLCQKLALDRAHEFFGKDANGN